MTDDVAEGGSAEERVTYRLALEYDGTDFQGWQQQPGERTVQACLESAVEKLFGEHVPVIGAGRTDAGVHALGQVAHIRTSFAREPNIVARALNSMLPPDVRIQSVTQAAPDFHARYSAKWRAYRYRIAQSPLAVGRQYAWQCPRRFDLKRMNEAAGNILGDCQFRAFAHANEKETHYLSTVFRAEWEESQQFVDFHIEANRFLHGMVRFLVGTFVDVGRGKINVEEFEKIVHSQDVSMAGPKAPARGLTLMAVGYHPWREL